MSALASPQINKMFVDETIIESNKTIKKKQVGRRTVRKKQTGIRTDPSKRRSSSLDEDEIVYLKPSRVELMNVTTQRRVGIGVKMLLMRLDVDDGLALPLMGTKDEDFDHQEFVHPRSYEVEDLHQVLSEEMGESDVLQDVSDGAKESLGKDEELISVPSLRISKTKTKINLKQRNERETVLGKQIGPQRKQMTKSPQISAAKTFQSEESSTCEENDELELVTLTTSKMNELCIKNTHSILGSQSFIDNVENCSITKDQVSKENLKLLQDRIEDVFRNDNSVVKVILAQNGLGVKVKLRNEMELLGHLQIDSSNWFLLPTLSRYLFFNLFSPKKLAVSLDGMVPQPALLTSKKPTEFLSTSMTNKEKSIQFLKEKFTDGTLKSLTSSIGNESKNSDVISHEEDVKKSLEAAEFIICYVEGCCQPIFRDDFYTHVQESHLEVTDLEQFIFYNEHLQLSMLDYFKSCGACTNCGSLFLSMGLIPWERINGHYEKEHTLYTTTPQQQRIKPYDLQRVFKGTKRGRGRPPVMKITPPVGSIYVGEQIFMVPTGTGPSGQPSYTPLNLLSPDKLNKKIVKDVEDTDIEENPTKKRKYLKQEIKEDVSCATPRISSRLKKKSLKAEQLHFLDEFDDQEWLGEDSNYSTIVTDPDFEAVKETAEETENPTEDVKYAVSNKGDMNREFIKDLVYFFNLYLGVDICKRVMRSIEDKRSRDNSVTYRTREVKVRTSPLPDRNENGDVLNQKYCCKINPQEVEAILEQDLGPIFLRQNLVAQQYSYVNNVRCTERVCIYQFETQPELCVAVKTYVLTTTGLLHDLINVTVTNKNADTQAEDQFGLKATSDDNDVEKEMKLISSTLSNLSCRDSKPRFDERGLIMTQRYCCNKTLPEVLAEWWQPFLEMTQAKQLTATNEKLKLKRKLPINGTDAMPEKKLYKANFDTGQQSLEVDFTYFNTTEGSLNLTFVCVQWIRRGLKVESDHIDLPSMVDFDSLTVYRRHKNKGSSSQSMHKSYYKSSEINFQENVKVLVNKLCVPRNQAIFSLQNKGRMVAELRSYLGMFHPTRQKQSELFIGGYKYIGNGGAYRRSFDEIEYDLVVVVTQYKFDKAFTDSSCPEDMPQYFSQADIYWVNKPVKGLGSSQVNARVVDDSAVPFYPKPNSIRRNYRYKTDPEMLALNDKIGTRAITNRLKILNKNKSSATRPGMQTINNLYNRKPKDVAAAPHAQDEVAVAVRAIPGGTRTDVPATPGKKGRKKGIPNKRSQDSDDEAELKCFKDQLISFDSLVRFPRSITYNKKQENGMVMVKNCKRLLYALVGSTTAVHPTWHPIHLEVETYEPSLTNAHMVMTCFSVPSVVHRGRKTPKVCLGPICLSATKSDEDATILGEHLRYNNENVTQVRSMSAMNDELYNCLRNGMKAFTSVFLYDESNVLNSATNRAKCQKHTLKLNEVALSHEIGAITVSWEVYMDKVIGLKHESDMTDLLLSLEEGEEYMLTDEEGKRLFQLTELEKSLLDEDELRYYEIEFFEWLGTGKYPDMAWKDYVKTKVGFNSAAPNQVFHSKGINENDFESWNSDQSYDNQFFGNIILQKGTLPKQQYHKIGKKKRQTGKSGIRALPVKVATEDNEDGVYTQTYTTIEENPAVFSAFDRVVVDGTFMI